ncbi:hypothetical protein XM38_012600 [Halomicronema hongdechloris C2206]|uniref:Uncharacterized protein n=1 Tax=Halomicronema hongdechloris C2206 TaxID=1641165 RepID=A0A1Z3HJ33_9CYAN|nr:hypothetical protein [Halomicronema hongdechloris]ASC70322.1 hypothetical protein XM38_012600 [Halomicronema hongdechloris C2206]
MVDSSLSLVLSALDDSIYGQVVLQVSMPSASLYLAAQGQSVGSIGQSIAQGIDELGGTVLRQELRLVQGAPHLRIQAQLSTVSHDHGQRLRTAVIAAGGDVRRLRLRFPSHGPNFTQRQPSTCLGCRHYYGRGHGRTRLICAMHPLGPETDPCPDYN